MKTIPNAKLIYQATGGLENDVDHARIMVTMRGAQPTEINIIYEVDMLLRGAGDWTGLWLKLALGYAEGKSAAQ
eukprot:4771358-Pyramimonas_sp.AAC.1